MTNKKPESLTAAMERHLNTPVDPETLEFAMSLFQEASSGRMTGSHIPKPQEPGLHLTNVPMNRGMMAIVRETRHLDDDVRQSLMLRVMHFGETVELALAEPRLAAHVKVDGTALEISHEFMAAYSGCRFDVLDGRIRADIEGLAVTLVDTPPT